MGFRCTGLAGGGGVLIRLFTDFGWSGPYVGQLKTRLASAGVVVDLMHDAPCFDPRASAYLLAALRRHEPSAGLWLAVVDPGVGSARRAVALQADGHWWLGPDNGLLSQVVRRSEEAAAWELPVPEGGSATFHGRDVFAPAALQLLSQGPSGWRAIEPRTLDRPEWPDDWAAVIYIDGYGNAMTGLRVEALSPGALLEVGGRVLPRGRIFAERPRGEAFWYVNSLGLVEVALNQDSAARRLGLVPGTPVRVVRPGRGLTSGG